MKKGGKEEHTVATLPQTWPRVPGLKPQSAEAYKILYVRGGWANYISSHHVRLGDPKPAEVITARSDPGLEGSELYTYNQRSWVIYYHRKGFPRSARFSSEDQTPTQTYVDFRYPDLILVDFWTDSHVRPEGRLGKCP